MKEALPLRLAALSPEQRKALKERLSQLAALDQTLRVEGKEEHSPASSGQERLWMLSQLEPDSPAYIYTAAIKLEGVLNVDALERTVREITRRHEVLRTVLSVVNDELQQKVLPQPNDALPLIDLHPCPADMRQQVIQYLVDEESRKAFDLAHSWPVRLQLICLDEKEHVLLIAMHHIAADGWSMRVFLRELALIYPALAAGKSSPLPELPVQYSDFARWQLRGRHAAALEKQIAFWKAQLEGAPRVLELPSDRPRPITASYHGALHRFAFSKSLTQALRNLSQREGATLFMTLLAAFNVLLHRYTGRRDILVGSPVAGRNRSELEGLIGFFLNMLVLRTKLDGDPTFRQLLARVRETAIGAYAHQEVPFERLVQDLGIERSTALTPLYQVIFSYENAPVDVPDAPGLAISLMETDRGGTVCDLTLQMANIERGITGFIEYRTDLFDAATIARMEGHLRTLLESIVSHPDEPVSSLPMLTCAEREQILTKWNSTRTEYPREKCIHQILEQKAAESPSATAVGFENQSLTYRELNARANRLARLLRANGVGPDVLVGVCMERSLETIVALVAVLKAGGAFAPLDPAYPPERLAFMLRDTAAPVLLTQRKLAGRLPEHTAKVIFADEEQTASAGDSGADLPCISVPANLAYVMYTSGSTGRPKGVCIPHQGVVRLVENTNFADFDAQQVFLLLAPLSFDLSTLEIWGPLLHGGKLVVMSPGTPSLHELSDVLRQQKVTTLWLTAGLFHQMVDGCPEGLSGVRQLLAGGDILSVPHVQKTIAALGRNVLIDGYGPTENTTFTTCYTMTRQSQVGSSVPIGKPIANTTVYILDRNMHPVPVGIPGELYTGGDGLARGYLNRPELTASVFVPNPWGNGTRLYKTGDLARWMPDGNIEFFGRIDNQVKIRGHRVELGEIEETLGRHPDVGSCVVVAREDTPGDKRLVAYLQAAEGKKIDVDQVRSALQTKLPAYMVPSAFVVLDSLPLSPNGKVDRRALPAPRVAADGGTRAEATQPLHAALARIWEELLGAKEIGIRDSFFKLGGHSLLAIRLINRIERELGVRLPLSAIFATDTVEGLASLIQEQHARTETRAAPTQAKVELAPAPDRQIARRRQHQVLSFAQQALWFLDHLEPGNSFYNVPLALRIDGDLNTAALQRVLDEIVTRHEALRTNFAAENGTGMQIVGEPAAVRLVTADLSSLPVGERDAALQRRLANEIRRPFDLSQDALLRALLIRVGEREHVLLLTMHHIVCDGWSLEILQKEMAALYDAFAAGRPSPLPELPIRYADFAAWQRDHLKGEVLERELSYWMKRLAGPLPVLDLPSFKPRPPVQTYNGAVQSIEIPERLLAKLKAVAEGASATPFMLMLACFKALLHRYTGQPDLIVGSPIAGRNQSQTEGLIGLFVNTLALRTDAGGDPEFLELLKRVRQTVLEAFEHQDAPLEVIVERLQPPRSRNRTPIFQVMFAMTGHAQHLHAAGAITLSPQDVPWTSAKHDLTMFVAENGALKASIEYNTDLFDAPHIGRMLLHFRNLLEGVAANPQHRISELPLLDSAEKAELVQGWNQTRTEYAREKCVHQIFEEQSARTPHATALVFGEQSLTYGALNVRANQLARCLRERGIGPDVLVAVCMERSIETVVALLAILKAGGAFAPLDPAYPRERLAFMLLDTHAPVLLLQSRLKERLPALKANVICLDGDGSAFSTRSEANLENVSCPENLAYVMYTSGSTGRPKGVCVPHRAVVRLVQKNNFATMGPDEASLLLAPTSFDASTLEIWAPLLNGGRLAIMPPRTPTLRELSTALTKHRITMLWLTAGLFNQMVDGAPEGLRNVRQVLTGGEALSPAHVRKMLETIGSGRLINGYGPTENTTFTCCYAMAHDTPIGRSVPIGRPIANTRVYVLDRAMNPVPVGVTGELYAGGDGLSRGYLNRPELTAERFVPDPFEPGARLYRTGDVVRYLPDGNIEFIGRNDDQVKIRGHRIEPGEVEVLLSRHADIAEAVVLVREDTPGNKRLVAYVKPRKPITAEELRKFLREKLPEYMVPSALVILDFLPLNANGKVDRSALPAPVCETAREGPVQPWLPLQAQILAIWEELLGAQSFGVRDDFFELGGHSLLALQMMDRVEQACGRRVPLNTLFSGATVESLCAALLAQQSSQAEAEVVEVQSGTGGTPFFYLDGDFQSGGFYCRELARQLGPDHPFYSLRPFQVKSGIPAIEQMAAHRLKLLREIAPSGPYILGGFCADAIVAWQMAQILWQDGERVELLVMIDPPPPTTLASLARLFVEKVPPFSRRGVSERLREFNSLVGLAYRLDELRRGGLPAFGRAAGRLARRVLRRRRVSPETSAAPPLHSNVDQMKAMFEAYHWALSGYRPPAYDGNVCAFWSEEARRETRAPQRAWQTLAPNLQAHLVPGEHLTVITRHVSILAQRIKEALAGPGVVQSLVTAREHGAES
ncbi:MAG TPA: amino acid adenylation domain-containing protein [Planctomycetota bacterium]|jgi:amino acid adenylation domain-containing protein